MKLLTIKNRFKNHNVKPTNSVSADADLVPLEITEQMICKTDNYMELWHKYNQHFTPIMDSEGKPTGNYEDNDMVILLMHIQEITKEMYESLADLFYVGILEE